MNADHVAMAQRVVSVTVLGAILGTLLSINLTLKEIRDELRRPEQATAQKLTTAAPAE